GRPVEGVSHRADHLGRNGGSVPRAHAASHARRDRSEVQADRRAARSVRGTGPRRRRCHPVSAPTSPFHGRTERIPLTRKPLLTLPLYVSFAVASFHSSGSRS